RLTKEIKFKTLAIIHIPSSIIGGAVGIFLAVHNFGVWSLVYMQLATRLCYSVQIWIYAKWKPSHTFELKAAKNLFSFGGKLLLADLITTAYNNIFLVVIGKYFSLASVGYYQNAFNLSTTPSNTITNILRTVTFPAFSSIQS